MGNKQNQFPIPGGSHVLINLTYIYNYTIMFTEKSVCMHLLPSPLIVGLSNTLMRQTPSLYKPVGIFVQSTWQACTADNIPCYLLSELSAQADEFLHNTQLLLLEFSFLGDLPSCS